MYINYYLYYILKLLTSGIIIICNYFNILTHDEYINFKNITSNHLVSKKAYH